ncbi:LppU/SCO3897 family protein, partial [Streptomyces sp. URMC 127]
MATPPPYQQQNPYQQHAPQQAHGYGYGAPAPAPVPAGPVCRTCGGFPAAEATIRQHQGILIMMRFLHVRGPFCRNCGLAVLRDMNGKTLLQGWWSPMSLA